MENCEVYEIGKSALPPGQLSSDTLPSLLKQTRMKSKILAQRSLTFNTRTGYQKPSLGQEYDFRRSPDGRTTPRKMVSHRRPLIPANTQMVDANGNDYKCESPTLQCQTRKKSDRCPTPIPNYQQTLTPRSAWDQNNGKTCARNNNNRNNVELDIYDGMEILTPRPDFMAPKRKANVNKYDVIVSDLDIDRTEVTPAPDQPLSLTEGVIHYYFQHKMDKDKRIARWLVDCEEKTCVSSLPAHLPDITAARRNVQLSTP